MPEGCKRYVKEMSRQLHCSQKVKRRLLDQFEAYQKNAHDYGSDCTYDRMVADFGPPEEMACELMRDVTAAERNAFRHSVLIRKVIEVVFIIAFIAATFFIWFLKSNPVNVIEYSFEGTIPVSDTKMMEDN